MPQYVETKSRKVSVLHVFVYSLIICCSGVLWDPFMVLGLQGSHCMLKTCGHTPFGLLLAASNLSAIKWVHIKHYGLVISAPNFWGGSASFWISTNPKITTMMSKTPRTCHFEDYKKPCHKCLGCSQNGLPRSMNFQVLGKKELSISKHDVTKNDAIVNAIHCNHPTLNGPRTHPKVELLPKLIPSPS